MRTTKGRLLFVEDHVETASTVSNLLSLQGYTVDIATSANMARTQLLSGHYDLIVCDMCLSDGNGRDLFLELHSQRRALGVAVSRTQNLNPNLSPGALPHALVSTGHTTLVDVIRRLMGDRN